MIEDAIYGRVRLRGNSCHRSSLSTARGRDQIDSFSKIAFPGLRVGGALEPKSAIERLRLVKQSTDLHTDQLAQATLAEFTSPRLLGTAQRENEGVDLSRPGSHGSSASGAHAGRDELDPARWGDVALVTLPPGFLFRGTLDSLTGARRRCSSQAGISTCRDPEPNTLRLGLAKH